MLRIYSIVRGRTHFEYALRRETACAGENYDAVYIRNAKLVTSGMNVYDESRYEVHTHTYASVCCKPRIIRRDRVISNPNILLANVVTVFRANKFREPLLRWILDHFVR